MSRSQAERRSLKHALAISVALHFLLVPLFVVSSAAYESRAPRTSGNGGGESATVAYLTISHRAVVPRKPSAVARPSTAVAPQKVPERYDRATTPVPGAKPQRSAVAHAASRALTRADAGRSAPLVRSAGAAARIALTLATPAPERERTTPTGRPTPATVATVIPAATASPASASPPADSDSVSAQQVASHGIDVPPGGWGQTFEKPLLADESALAGLRAKFRGARAIAIDVDESGRATHVTLPRSVPDDIRADLERNLLALRYVPAECNGLRCTGTLLISL